MRDCVAFFLFLILRFVVNVLQGHPFDPVLATVGIDHTVKVLQPLRPEKNTLANEEGVRRENTDRVYTECDCIAFFCLSTSSIPRLDR